METTPHGATPVPDPTVLTTEALLREVSGLKVLLEQRIEQVEKAVELAHANLVRVPTEVDRAIAHLREVVDQKFVTVEKQFFERDTRVQQTAQTSKDALDAALEGAKELVGKQNDYFVTSIAKAEFTTNKQIEQLGTLINTMTAANASNIGDLKERLVRLEGARLGAQEVQVEKRSGSATLISTVGLVIALVVALSAVGSLLLRFVGH